MKRVLIIGANSAIARKVAELFAAEKAALFLVSRDRSNLEAVAQDLRVRGASQVYTACFEALETDAHEALVSRAFDELRGIDVALIAHGALSDQEKCETSWTEAEKDLRVNFLSIVSILTPLANLMEREKNGCIAVISSVAGDRGRQSNYIYGAAKGAVTVFLQGLRNRLARNGVHVLTVKPGFVSTPMTAHLRQGPLFAEPGRVAEDICRAIQKRKNVLYTPWFWKYIMLVIIHMPESIFKKLKL